MRSNNAGRAVWLSVLAVGMWAMAAGPVLADGITYNYKANWLFDSATGYYWRTEQIPNATAVPSWGSVADSAALRQLIADAGFTGLLDTGLVSTPAPYSPPLANFLSFFASDKPASSRADIDFANLYLPSLERDPNSPYPGLEYEYYSFSYTITAEPTYRDLSVYPTIGGYYPGRLCGSLDCPETSPAFVYSTTAPTPLPSGVWLLISGLGLLLRNRYTAAVSANGRSVPLWTRK